MLVGGGRGSGMAGRAPGGRFWLSSREVAALTGATDRGVRWELYDGPPAGHPDTGRGLGH